MSDVVSLWQEMADHTKPECGKCRLPHSCCDRQYCETALLYAKPRGVDLTPLFKSDQRVPFLHNNQCVVPPHLRPLCTLHTCDINALGFKKGDEAWTDRYFEIRDAIDAAELAQDAAGILPGSE